MCALVGVGLLPVPGPFAEAVLVVAAALLFGSYRGPLPEAWIGAAETGRGPRRRRHSV